jgi:hypothetical protein
MSWIRSRAFIVAVSAALAALTVTVFTPSAQAATVADTTPPTAPTGLTWSANCAGVVTFNWTAAIDDVGVTGYEVFREVSTGVFAVAGTTITTTFVEPRIAGLRYQVRARDAAGNTSPFTAPVIPVPPPCPPPDTRPPTIPGTPMASITCGAAMLTWTASTDNFAVTGYEVWRASGSSSGTFVQVATVTTTSFTTIGPGFFRFQVRARDAAGNRSPFTPPVNVAIPACPNETQPPTAPGTPTASCTTATRITRSWAASTDNIGVTGYDIYRAIGAVTVTTPGGGGWCSATLTPQTAWNAGYVLQPNTAANTGTTT